MTSEAVAVVQAFFDRSGTDDFVGLSDLLDPDVVWFGTRGGLDEGQVMRGPEAVLEYLREIQETWERFDVQVEELVDTGDAVVALMRESAKAGHGGPEVQSNTAVIIKVRDRRVVEMTGYLDRDEALRAARSA